MNVYESMKASNIFVITLVFAGVTARAQDGHYWTQQYGTRSMLLSGSVVGGVEDLGTVYYNPGRLAVISNAAFLLSANIYEYNSMKVTNAFGNSKDASKSSIRGVPSLAAGTFRLKFLPKHHFAYAIMTRQSSDLSFSYKTEVTQDVLSASPGDEHFAAEVSLTQKSNEQWIGLCWAYPISSKFSVGVTTNYTTNNQNKGALVNLEALTSSNDVAIYRYNRGYNFTKAGLLWKAGLSANLGKWALGLTVTTPNVNLNGKATYRYEEFLSSPAGLLASPNQYSSDTQEKLPVNYKTPWSVGTGASVSLGKNKIHFSTEWFSAVRRYTLIQASDFTSQSDPTRTISFQLVDQLKSVWNAGLGLEFYLSDKLSGFGSFSTDYTAVRDDLVRFAERQSVANNSGWNADFYHVSGGFVINLKWADITLGATHTGATESIPRPINFPDGSGQPIFDPTQQSTVKWDRWRFVFGFSLPFLKDYASKLTDSKK